MKPRTLPLIEQCIELGVTRGYRLAHKHTEEPTEQAIIDRITDTVMEEFHDWFTFDHNELPNLDL